MHSLNFNNNTQLLRQVSRAPKVRGKKESTPHTAWVHMCITQVMHTATQCRPRFLAAGLGSDVLLVHVSPHVNRTSPALCAVVPKIWHACWHRLVILPPASYQQQKSKVFFFNHFTALTNNRPHFVLQWNPNETLGNYDFTVLSCHSTICWLRQTSVFTYTQETFLKLLKLGENEQALSKIK